MIRIDSLSRRIPIFLVTLLLLTVCALVMAPDYRAQEAVSVATEQELLAALGNDAVGDITVTVPELTLGTTVTIDRTIAISGGGAVLRFAQGAQLATTEDTTLSLSYITLASTVGNSVDASGIIELGDGVVLAGDMGIMLRQGSSLTSGRYTVSAAESVTRAISVSAGSGIVSISDFRINHPAGEGTLVYLNHTGGTLLLGGTVAINTAAGSAVMCPAGGSGPEIVVGDSGALTVSAPAAVNSAGEDYVGGAIDNRSALFSTGIGSTVTLRGSNCAIIAKNITLGKNSTIYPSCAKNGSSTETGRTAAALSASASIAFGEGASVIIGSSESVVCNGVYAGESITLGKMAAYSYRGNGEQYSAMCTPGTTTLGEQSSVVIRDVQNGIISEDGLITAEKCTLNIAKAGRYGIFADGTLQANKLYFDTNNTITIDAGYCAIYTRESVNFCEGSLITLSAGTNAPALWVAADNDSQGHLTVSGATVYVNSQAGAAANGNAGVYVVGVINIEESATVTCVNSGDFGIISAYGDISISTGGELLTSGGCGIYLLNGDLLLSSGGGLMAEGKSDSAVRVERGVLNCGDDTRIDAQGVRFGVEVLGNGGVWITRATSFDIRSTGDRAIYIEEGSLNISGTKRLSAWLRDSSTANEETWWSGVMTTGHSWDISKMLSDSGRLYADFTMLSPNISQTFANGTPGECVGGEWFNGSWAIADYSRLAMYKTQPLARSNQYYIPAGKSFSWWLYGESYDGAVKNFTLVSHQGEGEFILNETGKFTYSAPAYTRGVQSFSFTAENNDGVVSDPVTVSIMVTASKPPIATSTTFETESGQQIIDQLEMIDYDGAISDTRVVDQPQHGDLLMSSDGKFSYTPDTAFFGIDTFTYCAVDDMGDESNLGYVSIAVNQKGTLTAGNSTLITESGVAVSARLVTLAAEMVDENGETVALLPEDVTFELTEQPTYGVIEFVASDTIEYTPYEDFAGTDVIRFVATDAAGNRSNEAIVTIAMIPNQRPVATSLTFTCVKGSKCRGKLSADDVDGSVVRYELVNPSPNGEITLDELTGEFTLQIERGFVGQTTFSYRVQDSDGLYSREAVVTIEATSLIENLRRTGKLAAALIALGGVVMSAVVIAILLVSTRLRRRKEEEVEMEKNRLLNMLNSRGEDEK